MTRTGLAWHALWLALAFAFAGTRPLWEPDEGRYAEAARGMVASGDWLVPRLQGEPHLTKPPLTYWSIAAGLQVFGVNEWAARLPTAAAFWGTLLGVLALARAWGWRDAEARGAALVFGTALLPFACGHVATTDMILTVWLTLAMLAYWKVQSHAERTDAWRAAFWAALGMALLTKGTPALLPLLVVVVHHGLAPRRPSDTLAPRIGSWPGLIIMLTLGTFWYGLLEVRMPGTIRRLWYEEVYLRLLSTEHGREKTMLFYFYVVPLGLTPWLFLWPPLARRVWRKLGLGDLSSEAPLGPRVRRAWAALSAPERFSLVWFGVPFLVFTLVPSRMYFYIVPYLVPVALWAGRVLVRAGYAQRLIAHPKWAGTAAAAWAAVLVVIAADPFAFGAKRDYRPIGRALAGLATDGGAPTVVCLEEPLPHSISFYSGARLTLNKAPLEAVVATLEIEALMGRPALLLIKQSELQDVAKQEGVRWEPVAENPRHALIRILPTRMPSSAPDRRV